MFSFSGEESLTLTALMGTAIPLVVSFLAIVSATTFSTTSGPALSPTASSVSALAYEILLSSFDFALIHPL
jgi:hypothetical protein